MNERPFVGARRSDAYVRNGRKAEWLQLTESRPSVIGRRGAKTGHVGFKAVDGQAIPVLGTGIVDALAKQLGATVTISDRGPGTNVSVVRPS